MGWFACVEADPRVTKLCGTERFLDCDLSPGDRH